MALPEERSDSKSDNDPHWILVVPGDTHNLQYSAYTSISCLRYLIMAKLLFEVPVVIAHSPELDIVLSSNE